MAGGSGIPLARTTSFETIPPENTQANAACARQNPVGAKGHRYDYLLLFPPVTGGPMANIAKISVAMPTDMLALVRRAVESGDYASTSEVIREALREWKGRRETREEAIEELRRLWREGLESPVRHALDTAKTKREGRRQLDQAKAIKGQRGK